MKDNQEITNDSRVIIVLMGALGDVVRGLSLPSRIKADYPNCHITWLIEPKWKDFVFNHPFIDEVIVFNRAEGFSALKELKAELKSRNFDICFDLQRHFKSGFFSLLTGAKRRIGFSPKNSKEGNFLFNNDYIPYFSKSYNKIDHYHAFLDYAGVEKQLPYEFHLDFLRSFELPAEAKKISGNFCSIVLGSSWESKDWFTSGYRNLIDQLLGGTSLNVFLLGDPSQSERGKKLASHFETSRVLNLAGVTSLLEMASVVACSNFVIGPDSGPGHIAAALGVPYISLFGPTDPGRVAPYLCEKYLVKSSIGCAPCYKKNCPGPNKMCMRLISADAVMAKLHEEGILLRQTA